VSATLEPTNIVEAPLRSSAGHVRLLEADPDLGAGLDAEQFADASRRLVIPGLLAGRGPWTPPQAMAPMLGAMVVEGALLLQTDLCGHATARLIGPGDYMAAPNRVSGDWHVIKDARLAILDDRLALGALRWPVVGAALAQRLMEAQEEQATRAAINTIGRVDRRVLAMLTHFANRWGRVTAEGLVLDLPLTHEMLGWLVGARRPTVSLALTGLREQGLLTQNAVTRHWIMAAP
jgi:CRP/FNR family cyclic AMP-dependent transcriptional regulator